MSTIETRTIASVDKKEKTICKRKFIIKDYQRGYRWERKQIRELLDDIYEFESSSSHKEKYCMQPLVVKKIMDEEATEGNLSEIISGKIEGLNIVKDFDEVYELIDGQQRLTTSLLILSVCNKTVPYEISYSFFRRLDRYYIDKAIETIDSWFNEKFDPMFSETLKNEFASKVLFDLLFIWYEVDENAKSTDIFTRLNIGKIPLTNAELFKALLLNEDNLSSPNPIEKESMNKIAIEWDFIEKSLRDDEFWGFISKENTEPRIDLLLKFFALSEKLNSPDSFNCSKEDPLFPFLLVCEKLKNKESTEKFDIVSEIWSHKIVFLHDLLKTWYEDINMYHYIGFLVQISKDPLEKMVDIIASVKNKKKSEKESIIKNMIKKEFDNIKIDDLEYDDRDKVRKVLLFFNIQTMVTSKTKTRFSFYQYNLMKWNIEHIHSRADEQEIKRQVTVESRKNLLEELKNQFSRVGNDTEVNNIDNFINNRLANATPDEFMIFYTNETSVYGDVDTNSIGNLTLLDEETNKMYHNSLFPLKRNEIIRRDKGEVFIPVCTKNVFLKMYSTNVVNPSAWTCDDAREYVDEIKRVLVTEAKLCQ